MITIEFSSTITDYDHILITYGNTTNRMSSMYVDFQTLCLLLQNFGYNQHEYLSYIPFDYHGVKIYAPLKKILPQTLETKYDILKEENKDTLNF